MRRFSSLLKQNQGTSLMRILEKAQTIKPGMNRGKQRLVLDENFRSESGTSLIQILLVMVVMITVLIMSGIFNPPKSPVTDKTEHEAGTGPSVKKSALSIIELPIMSSVSPTVPAPIIDTPTPTPLVDCPHDTGIPITLPCYCPKYIIECKNKKCVSLHGDPPNPPLTCDQVDNQWHALWCDNFTTGNGTGTYCVEKPVIYLYPEKDTLVDVAIKTEGKVVVSDPLIETTNGWHDVLAHPDGTLIYKNKQYKELFYESETRDLKRPKAGIVVTKQNLKTELLSFITRLGLTREDEQEEFLDWWIPRLQQIKTDKIFISILEKDEKERLDRVIIKPKPDTMIEFMAYFAPFSDNETINPLILPDQPKRVGFTAVEWGGVIGK